MRRHETHAQWLARNDAHFEQLMAAAHFVYRAFDSYGHLLYVGCTKNTEARLATHRSQAPWFRFAETLAVAGPYEGRDAGRAVEMQAILSEGPYFNSSPENHRRNQANLNAAKRVLWRQGWYRPDVDLDPELDDLDPFFDACDAIRPEQAAWDRALERERDRLKAGAYPYMTAEDRMERYLAAREDAELARTEAAA